MDLRKPPNYYEHTIQSTRTHNLDLITPQQVDLNDVKVDWPEYDKPKQVPYTVEQEPHFASEKMYKSRPLSLIDPATAIRQPDLYVKPPGNPLLNALGQLVGGGIVNNKEPAYYRNIVEVRSGQSDLGRHNSRRGDAHFF
jgi:hypothetical protein